MSESIHFQVPLVPVTINRLSREHWSKRVAAKKLWMRELAAALHFGKPLAIATLRAWADCKDRVRIEITVLHAREFDPDNLVSAAKIPLDALKGLGCIVDDSSRHVELHVSQNAGPGKSTFFRVTRIK